MKRYIVAITGASGSIYALRLLEELCKIPCEVHLVMSSNGSKVFQYETGYTSEQLLEYLKNKNGTIILHNVDNLFASIASGSFKTHGMVVVPCSMSTLAEMAMGVSKTLLTRAADVALKEKRKLIVVPRETPLSTIHLRNMLSLSETGAVIMPAMPSFYHKPTSLEDIVNSLVGRILDSLEIENNLYNKWGEDYEKSND